MILTMIHGLCMALADSVPGVSGGTIAFIMGFYERFLEALHNIINKDSGKRREAAVYLIKIGIGWVIGMSASVMVLSRIFESHIYFLSSLFMGFMVAAIVLVIYEEKATIAGKYKWIVFAVLGAAVVVLLSLIRTGTAGLGNINFLELGLLQYAYLFIAGTVAISAMLLPGISGSTILLILGVYVPAINCLRQLLGFDLRYLPGAVALGLGIIFGILFVSRLIKKGLQKYRPQMVYLILGLMFGSIYSIMEGPTTLDVPQPALTTDTFSISAFIIGIAVIGGLELTKHFSHSKEQITEQEPQ